MTELVKKRRIFHIAKELNISHLEIMSFLKEDGISVSSHMAPVDADVYDKILGEFSKERQQIERLRKEKARQAVVSNIKKQQRTDTENDVLSSNNIVTSLDPMDSLKKRISNEKDNLTAIKGNKRDEKKKENKETKTAKQDAIGKNEADKTNTSNEFQNSESPKPNIDVGLKVVRRATDAEKEQLVKQNGPQYYNKRDAGHS